MQLILQTANVTADAKNCSYPNKVTVTNASELQEAVKMDHVCAKYKNNYRSIDNFLKSNDLNVSYRTVHRIHASALNNFVVPE